MDREPLNKSEWIETCADAMASASRQSQSHQNRRLLLQSACQLLERELFGEPAKLVSRVKTKSK